MKIGAKGCLAHYAIAIAIAATSGSCYAAENGTIPALKLTQRHYYWGDMETIVSKLGVRLENKGKMRFILVAKAPKWNVTAFRNDDKKFREWTLKQFSEDGIVSDFIVSRQDRHVPNKQTARSTRLGDVTVTNLAHGKTRMAFLPLSSYAAPQVESVLYTIFKQPTNGGIPVMCLKRSGRGGKDWLTGLSRGGAEKSMLTTSSIKKIRVSPDFFNAPSGFTSAKSVQEVLLSRADREASGDVDELFEIGKKKR